jgi:NitT/TauT family transport system ATP-binding protein
MRPKKTVLFVTHSIDEAVYLSDEVVTIAGKPGRLASSTPIDIARPRPARATRTWRR